MPQLLRFRESLASRISLWVVFCVVVILTVTVFVGQSYVVKNIKLEGHMMANDILYVVGQSLDAELVSVEAAVRNHLGDIRESLEDYKMTPADDLYRITQRILDDNPDIVGSTIAFRADFFPEKGKWFAPYSYRDGATVRSKQLGNGDYDYHMMDWYRTADSLRNDYWSEPYFDKGGGEMLMTTYSCPLKDEKGEIIAVVTADILLDKLSKLLDLKYYNNAYACMVSRNGTFISHPDKELVLKQTVFSVADAAGRPELKGIGKEMTDGKSGMGEWKSSSGDRFVFFMPFEHTGWSMAIVCNADELFKDARKMALVLGVLFVLMLLVLTWLMRRGVHRLVAPLTTFTLAADEVAHGNLETTLPDIHSRDEMLRLHRSFSTMQQSLVQQMEELKRFNEAKGRIEGELKAAKDIQLSMLPKAYTPAADNNRLDICGLQISAKEVGGDLYDFFIRGEQLFFCIGDVSGKGVPAALVMAMTLSQFRNVASYEDDLGKIVMLINKSRCEGNDTFMFVTFFVGVLHLPTGRLRYCNAGHNKPFIVSDSIAELPAKPDLPLGVDDGTCYTVRECNLPPAAMLFLYTDGLTEAMTGQREQFGSKRVIDLLTGENDCRHQIDKMTDAVRQFVGDAPQSDDLTMLAIRLNEKQTKQ